MVKAWREIVTIPTYEVGKPEKNPIFLEKRVYQGSSGVVYPYPVIESMSDEKKDVDYHAIWIENEYIKVMVLPELGGRVQMAYDKIRERSENATLCIIITSSSQHSLVWLVLGSLEVLSSTGPSTIVPVPICPLTLPSWRTKTALLQYGLTRWSVCSTRREWQDLRFVLVVPIWRYKAV